MNVRRLLAAAVLVFAVAGCGATNVVSPVASVPLSSLTILPVADTLQVGGTAAFTVVAIDTSGAVVASPVLSWGSTNTVVVTVTNGGVATARGEGTASIVVSSGGKTAFASILVLPAQRGWFTQPSGVSTNLNSVFFTPDGNYGWAVGATGKIIATTNAGATWLTQNSSVSTALNSVWFTSSTEGWAVGAGARVLHTANRGVTWTAATVGTFDLNAITFATPDTGWAVGANGTILRTFNGGASWTRLMPAITSSTLRSVAFSGTRDGWAVGDNGIIVGTHDRGLTWFIVQPALTSLTLYGVSRSSASAANAVGTGGATLRTAVTPDSVAWELHNVGALNDLRAVTFTDALNGWAAGSDGTSLVLATTDGGVNWAPQTTSPAFMLNGVRFVDSLRGWAVGNNGTILHTVTGGKP